MLLPPPALRAPLRCPSLGCGRLWRTVFGVRPGARRPDGGGLDIFGEPSGRGLMALRYELRCGWRRGVARLDRFLRTESKQTTRRRRGKHFSLGRKTCFGLCF